MTQSVLKHSVSIAESGMSSDDAAELEELRREAAVLREQLEQCGRITRWRAHRRAMSINSRLASTRLRLAIPN